MSGLRGWPSRSTGESRPGLGLIQAYRLEKALEAGTLASSKTRFAESLLKTLA